MTVRSMAGLATGAAGADGIWSASARGRSSSLILIPQGLSAASMADPARRGNPLREPGEYTFPVSELCLYAPPRTERRAEGERRCRGREKPISAQDLPSPP